MLKKFILVLCLLLSFIAGALFFAWKPLLISTLNQSLTNQDSGFKIAIIVIDNIKLQTNKLQIETLQFTVNGRTQTLKHIEVMGQLTQGDFSSVNIQHMILDWPQLTSTSNNITSDSDNQETLSAATISAQLQDLLSQLQADFRLHIANIELRQLALPASSLTLHSPNQQLITSQWQLGKLRLHSSLSLGDSELKQHNLLEDSSNKDATTVLWQQDSHCQDNDKVLQCKINAEIDMQQLALLSKQADIAAIAIKKLNADQWQKIQNTLEESQGHWSINAEIQQPFIQTEKDQRQAVLTINTTEALKLSLQQLLPTAQLQSLLIQQGQALTFHWQDQQLQQRQASHFNVSIIDNKQQPLQVSFSPQNSLCDASLNCSGSININSVLDNKSSKKHVLLKTVMKDLHWQQWQINPSLQWKMDKDNITLQVEDNAILNIKKLLSQGNDITKLVITPQALKLVYERNTNILQLSAKALHLDVHQFNNAQANVSAINLQLKQIQLRYKNHKLSGQSQLQGFIKQPQLASYSDTLGDIKLAGPIQLNTNQLDYSMSLKHANNTLLQLQGHHYLTDQSGHAQWHIPRLDLEATKPLHSVIGLTTFPLWINQGTLQANGQADWGDSTQLAGTLSFSGLNGSFDEYNFQGFKGTVMLQADDNNLSYASFGKITLAEVNLGLPVKEVNLTIHGRSDDNIIHIRDFRANLLDGELGLDEYQFDLNTDKHKGLLKLENLSLAEVIKVVDTPGLSGSGSLNGRLPFAITGTDFTINQGLVYSTPPGGLINYKDASLAESNAAMSYIYNALGNYHYQQMVSTIDLTKNGKLLLGVSMRGKNPDFENGRAINLNLNLDDDIMQQMRSFNAIENVTDKVEKHYQ